MNHSLESASQLISADAQVSHLFSSAPDPTHHHLTKPDANRFAPSVALNHVGVALTPRAHSRIRAIQALEFPLSAGQSALVDSLVAGVQTN